MKFKNCGLVERTFYGVTFKPGETRDVPGYIAAKNFIAVIDEAEEPTESQPKRNRVGRPPKSQQVEKDESASKETAKVEDKEKEKE